MSDFLKNLQNAVESGEFNSEAANKINAINEITELKIKDVSGSTNTIIHNMQEKIDERLKEAGVITFEEKMSGIEKEDLINSQIALLMDVEFAVRESIEDMMELVNEMDKRFESEFDSEKRGSNVTQLYDIITRIKNNYK